MPALLTAATEAEALEQLHAARQTDGLPVVIPTPERVARMVLASGQEADMMLGAMGPALGLATVEKVAVAAVMAGCLPDYMPLVMATTKAIIDPVFDLTEMQATTHCTAPLIIVNGPARTNCGPVASGFGLMGPGHRANAAIGRALRLAMINIGGGRPGESDMALHGHPGKFTFCIAEDEEHSPFPPLHTALGFDETDSVVTVVGAEAPHSVIYSGDADDPEDHLHLTDMLAVGLANAATNNAILTGGAGIVVLNPDHAQIYAAAGWSRQDLQAALHERCHLAADKLVEMSPGFAPKKGKSKQERWSAFSSPEQILVLVAGGGGLYSMVMPTWCAGAHKNAASSVAVEADFFCEVPGLAEAANNN
ncbi:MAG: hypothetical protein ACR2PJ_00375 [Pseudomonadales bacterium]